MIDQDELTQEEMLGAVTDAALYRVRTHLPAQVVSVNLSQNTVDVQPLIKGFRDGKGYYDLPVIKEVPIKYYGAGGFVVTFQPAVGDTCELAVHDRSIDTWKRTGGIIAPDRRHRHDLTDATAYFGLNDYANSVPSIQSGMDIRTKDGTTGVRVTDGAIEIRQGGTVIATMSASGVNFNVPVTIQGRDFITHTHPGDSGGNTGPVN